MSYTKTSLGPNSVKLTFTTPTILELTTAVKDVMLQYGWEVYDTYTAAANGTTGFVMRALNKDGSSYKYVAIRADTLSDFYIAVSESWDTSTHTALNSASINSTTFTVPAITISTTTPVIYVFVNSHYIYLSGNVNRTNQGVGAGVFEFVRDTPADTNLSIPCCLATADGLINGATNSVMGCSGGVPRDRGGMTNVGGAVNSAFVSALGMISNLVGSGGKSRISLGSVNQGNTVIADSPIYYVRMYLRSSSPGLSDMGGRVFGLKMLPVGYGAFGDTVSVLCDSDGFSNENGVATDHFVFNGYCLPL